MSIVAQRYARALMNLALKENQVDAVTEGLDALADTLAEAPNLSGFLTEPKVPQASKEAAVTELLEKLQGAPLLNTFARYLMSKRRIVLVNDIRRVFHELADERMGRAHADITVAAQMNKDQEERLRGRLEAITGLQVELRVKIDPEILGGLVARIGSTVWDASLRNQLNQIHHSIIEG